MIHGHREITLHKNKRKKGKVTATRLSPAVKKLKKEKGDMLYRWKTAEKKKIIEKP